VQRLLAELREILFPTGVANFNANSPFTNLMRRRERRKLATKYGCDCSNL
jgi:abortive infection bacteriophage resistance protein